MILSYLRGLPTIDVRALTPVEKAVGMYFKRDDLFAPFGAGGVNGGKLRQCFLLIEAAIKDYSPKGVVVFCSRNSPQAPITAAVAQYYGLPCICCYGGESYTVLKQSAMPRLAAQHGAELRRVCKMGFHNGLRAKCREIATANNFFLVDYGFGAEQYLDILLSATAEQVKNIPEELDSLYVTCGSGLTASGIILGLNRYRKKVNRLVLLATAPDRRGKIKSTVGRYGIMPNFLYFSVSPDPRRTYDKRERYRIMGTDLHPQYEAKAMAYIKKHKLDINNSLFWIVGAEPKGR